MSITFLGVPIDSVGTRYHCAIGYDDGTGNVLMVGYVLPRDSAWEQTSNLQDEGSLISVASPNQIDRNLSVWPKVTQGDWTKGEQQLTFIDPQRYRSTDGNVDTSRPGQLQLFPSARTTTYTLTGTSNGSPMVALGDEWFAGAYTGATNLVYATGGGVNTISIGDGAEILDIILTPYGVAFATGGGIWTTTGAPVATKVSNEGVAANLGNPSAECPKAMAYFGQRLFFITADQTQIKYLTNPAAVGGNTVFRTLGTGRFEEHFKAICSTANGLFYSTYKIGAEWNNILYTSDGGAGPDTRVAEINGKVEWCEEIYGVTYVLVRCFQSDGHNDFTLYSLQDKQFSPVIDYRWVPDEFKEVGAINFRGNVWGDGRFLYVGWPGQPGLRIDVSPGLQGAFPARCTPLGATNSITHKVVSSDALGILDANVYQTAGPVLHVTFSEFFQNPASGTITLSDIDFDTPGESKAFRAIFVELDSPMPAGASIDVDYAVDGSSAYLETVQIIDSTTRLTYRIPPGTVGRRISPQLTLTSGSGLSPVIRSIAIEGTLGRVWKASLQCFHEQQTLDSGEDGQGFDSQSLLANIENAFNTAARKVYCYVPSSTQPDQVEQVQAYIETYDLRMERPSSGDGRRLEATIDVTLKETL